MLPLCALVTVFAALRVPTAAARRVRISGGSGGDGDFSHFDATSSYNANAPVYAIFLLVLLVLLAVSRRALSRPGPRLPVASAAVTLAILAVGDALGFAQIFTVDAEGQQRVDSIRYINFQIAFLLFYNWTDLAVLATVALVLYNRYRSVQQSSSAAFIAFAGAACVLFVLMVTLIGVESAMYAAALTARFHGDISVDAANSRLQIADNIFCAYFVFHVFGTLLLTVSAFLVKAHAKKDIVTSKTIRIVIPLLLLRAHARLVFAVLEARLPISDSSTPSLKAEYALDFARHLVCGVLYLAAMSVLVFLLIRTHLWTGPPLYAPLALPLSPLTPPPSASHTLSRFATPLPAPPPYTV